jgi:hypothetical protein
VITTKIEKSRERSKRRIEILRKEKCPAPAEPGQIKTAAPHSPAAT